MATAIGLVADIAIKIAVIVLALIGEYLLMKSGSSGLQLTHDNTIQDLGMSFLGGVAAALVITTALWPRAGTPEAPFGWRVDDEDG